MKLQKSVIVYILTLITLQVEPKPQVSCALRKITERGSDKTGKIQTSGVHTHKTTVFSNLVS